MEQQEELIILCPICNGINSAQCFECAGATKVKLELDMVGPDVVGVFTEMLSSTEDENPVGWQ